jgi:hypothetical protein
MSKAVKKIGRNIKKVASGINKLQKKIRKSKAFKVIAIAAAVYFTGGAVLGAIKGAAAASATGTSVLAGAGQGALSGIGSAGAGISKAWGNLTQMQFKAAGNSLVGGISNAGSAGANAVTSGAGWGGSLKSGFAHTQGLLNPGAAQNLAAGVQGGAPATGGAAPAGGAPGAGGSSWPAPEYPSLTGGGSGAGLGSGEVAKWSVNDLFANAGTMNGAQKQAATNLFGEATVTKAIEAAVAPAKKGLLSTLVSNPLVPYAGMQLAGSMAQGHSQQQMVEDERDYGQQAINDDRKRRDHNMARLYTSRYTA